MPHGGYREPENPAAFSGPGQFSRRTDTQAGRLSGQPFGTTEGANARLRQARQQNGQAPVAPEGQPPRQQAAPGAPSGGLPNVFGAPTSRPDEPITAGSPDSPATILPDDPYTFLRALYREHPHPDVLRLLRRANAAQHQRQPPPPPPPIQGPVSPQGSAGTQPQRPLR